MVRTSSKGGKFWLSSWIWPWRSKSITPPPPPPPPNTHTQKKNNRTLTNVPMYLYLWSKFGDTSLNGSWVIVRTSKWLTHRRTDIQTQATTISEGQNWPRVKIANLTCSHQECYCTWGLTTSGVGWFVEISEQKKFCYKIQVDGLFTNTRVSPGVRLSPSLAVWGDPLGTVLLAVVDVNTGYHETLGWWAYAGKMDTWDVGAYAALISPAAVIMKLAIVVATWLLFIPPFRCLNICSHHAADFKQPAVSSVRTMGFTE